MTSTSTPESDPGPDDFWDDGSVPGCPSLAVLEESTASSILGACLQRHFDQCERCSRIVAQIRVDNALLAECLTARTHPHVPAAADHHPDGYELLGEIQRGGQGVVHKAFHIATRRTVALKMLLHGSFATSQQRRRLEREAELAARLRHPNIVTIYDSGCTAAGDLFLAMEYVEGVPLDQYVRGLETTGQRGVRAVLKLFVPICDAVAAAHRRGIIHRDLKPNNILVDSSGQPHVLDFGLARNTPDADWTFDSNRTLTGEFRGTFAYAAPEQVAGSPDDVDIRTDVYALGLLMYEMMTRVHPYRLPRPRAGGGVAELVRAIVEQIPPDPRSLNRAIDDELRTIILKAMAREPARRYQSAGALLDDLRHYLAGEAINAKLDSRFYILHKALVRHRMAAASAAALLLFAFGFAALMTVLYQRAATAELAAQRRERDLEQVVAFQAAQIGDIDVRQMGLVSRNELLANAHAVLMRQNLEPEEEEMHLADLQSTLGRLNFTDAARAALDDHVFTGMLDAIDQQFADQPLVRARLLHSLGTTLSELGLLQRAHTTMAEALAVRRQQLGDHDPATIESRQQIASMLRRLGRYDEAMLHLREVLEQRIDTIGKEHPDTLNSVTSMGFLLHAMGRMTEAEAYLRDAVETSRRILGEERPATLNAINGLCSLLQAQGRFAEAEEFLHDALETSRRVLGDDHRSTLVTMGLMAIVLRGQGQLDEAERYFTRQLEVLRRVAGDDHHSTLTVVNNLGSVYVSQGRYSEAERCFREVLDARRRLLGDAHQSTLVSMINLGAVLRELGHLDDALQLTAEAFRCALASLPPQHPRIADTASHHARTLMAMKRFEEAEILILHAHDIVREVFGDRGDRMLDVARLAAHFYDAWHEAAPDAGHETSTANWRAMLPATETDASGATAFREAN
jgi:eukaryotic-like serine/threonine-protein kinase